MGSRLQQPISIASNIFATLPCPRHLARVFLCRALPCVKLAAARAPWRMTRDPLAVARDLACLPRGARSAGLRCAIRRPWLAACDALPLPLPPLPAIRRPWLACPLACPLARDPMAAIRWPRSAGRGLPAPAPCLRSGVIRWPIRRHPMADPASSDGRSDGRSGVIRWPIRWPIRRHPVPAMRSGALQDTRSACQGPLWQLRLNGP